MSRERRPSWREQQLLWAPSSMAPSSGHGIERLATIIERVLPRRTT